MAKKMHKTVEVAVIRDKCNSMIAHVKGNREIDKGVRIGLITIVETILMDTGNYRGFRYTNLTDDMKDKDGFLLPGQPGDSTHRHYH